MISRSACCIRLLARASSGSGGRAGFAGVTGGYKLKTLLNINNKNRGLNFIVPQRNAYQKRDASTGATGIRLLWNKMFGKYLLTTNIVSSGILMVFGDIIAQEIEYRRHASTQNGQRYDMKRIARMFIVGALMGPMHHYVYNWMDRIMPIANFRNAVWKILIDQIVMSPACILLFFYSACYMEQKDITETNNELKEKFGYIYLMDWLVWPGVQYINFRYLDTKYRVMFVNVCTALYNIFLSYMKHDFETKLRLD